MTQPDELKRDRPLLWSPGTGVEVWEMFQAAVAGDAAALGRMLDDKPSLARCHYRYITPLYFAVRENRIEAARLLIERGGEPFGFKNPVEVARERGHAEMERVLREILLVKFNASERGNRAGEAIRARKPVDIPDDLLHAGDERGNQPIHWAVMTRQIALIDELVARGADINARRPDGAQPIYLANGDYHYRGWRDVPEEVETTPRQVIDHLIARGAYVDIWIAAYLGDLGRVRQLLDADAALVNRNSDYNSYYYGCGSALKNAAARGHIDAVRLLLERGADPNLPQEHIAPRGQALYSAVYNGHYEVAKLLLEHGAIPNVPVESSADALSIALSRSDARMVELLCSYGAARSVELLAYYGDVKTAAAVFDANPALANDPEALGNAAGQGCEAFVRLMLRYQPDLPKRFSGAAKTRELTELLFEHGMDANRRDWLGYTPLHEFAKRGDVENAALFLQHGADPRIRDEDWGLTAREWAERSGRKGVVDILATRE